ncbi:tyrosine recombinase XerC [Arthrobacter sp. GCM10027362]|uniref:site-specific integrase n=1 Tax=Arthrobacter sp. GCM10027362 TaxID=3273379 RepID=UPI00362B7977
MAEEKPRRSKGTGSRVSRTASGWKGYITVDGKREYFHAASKRAAEEKRRHLLNHPEEVRAKRSEKAGKPAPGSSSPTVSDLIDRWLNFKATSLQKPHRPKTASGYRDAQRLHINHAEYGIGDLDASIIDGFRIREFFTELRVGRGLGSSLVRTIHSLLNQSYEYAIEHGLVSGNPVFKSDRPGLDTVDVSELTEEQVGQLRLALRNHDQEARWLIALYMGLRPGEALAIERHHIDWKRKTLTVKQQLQQDRVSGGLIISPLKSSTSNRQLPIPDVVMDALWRQLKVRSRYRKARAEAGKTWETFKDKNGSETDFMFIQENGQPIRPRLDTTNWKRLLIQAGLCHDHETELDSDGMPLCVPDPISRYACRHYAATWMLSKGVDITTVSLMLGHTDIGLTVRTYVAKRVPAMETLGDKLSKAIEADFERASAIEEANQQRRREMKLRREKRLKRRAEAELLAP